MLLLFSLFSSLHFIKTMNVVLLLVSHSNSISFILCWNSIYETSFSMWDCVSVCVCVREWGWLVRPCFTFFFSITINVQLILCMYACEYSFLFVLIHDLSYVYLYLSIRVNLWKLKFIKYIYICLSVSHKRTNVFGKKKVTKMFYHSIFCGCLFTCLQ